ncbi:unnamed protein product [Spirodela intermedia]|uniref:Pentatricopeptide repeat-containing protein n=1 Tax=Spirodela intermedia TaxID=51605 RepID=A0ABN7E853_SPIIN|nr:unnamed protein product [Spirodela intermedia]
MRSTAATALAAQRTRPWNAAVAAWNSACPLRAGGGARQAFDEMLVKNAVTWTTLISGLTDAGYPAEARRVFNAMPVKSVPAWTAIVDGHMKDGEPGEARQCFDGMPLRNMVSWMAFIRGTSAAECSRQAFDRFVEMARTPGAAQNEFTFSLALGPCAGSSSLRSGEFLHADLIKCGGPPDAILVSSLVGMYAKCCDASVAARAFGSLGPHQPCLLEAVIGCYARQGLRARALAEFQRKRRPAWRRPRQLRLRPRRRARAGWCVRGSGHGSSTTCVVDLLGRAGELLGANGWWTRCRWRPTWSCWAPWPPPAACTGVSSCWASQLTASERTTPPCSPCWGRPTWRPAPGAESPRFGAGWPLQPCASRGQPVGSPDLSLSLSLPSSLPAGMHGRV